MTSAIDFVENYTGESPTMDMYRYAGLRAASPKYEGPASSPLSCVMASGTHGEEFHYRTPTPMWSAG
jgi:hypothetical protein